MLSTSLTTKEEERKISVRCQVTHTERAAMKTMDVVSTGEDVKPVLVPEVVD